VVTEELRYALSLSKERSGYHPRHGEVIGQRNGFRPVVIKDTE